MSVPAINRTLLYRKPSAFTLSQITPTGVLVGMSKAMGAGDGLHLRRHGGHSFEESGGHRVHGGGRASFHLLTAKRRH